MTQLELKQALAIIIEYREELKEVSFKFSEKCVKAGMSMHETPEEHYNTLTKDTLGLMLKELDKEIDEIFYEMIKEEM